MLTLLNAPFINFNGNVGASPAVEIFGFGIAYYALIIVTGIVVAMLMFAHLLDKSGLSSEDSLDYAVFVLPLAVLACRIYFFMFPYVPSTVQYQIENNLIDVQPFVSRFNVSYGWSEFWNFRDGGMGIYGGVIMGYIVVRCVAFAKIQQFSRIADMIAPCLLIAQSIGRWGNFVNQEAYGNLIENPAWQWFPIAVKVGSNYYQATFFYESFFTCLGGLFTFFFIKKSKYYRRGFNVAFYGVYYGVVRLIVESFRSDSLYLWIRLSDNQALYTGIKISQLVSWIAIVMGVIQFVLIFTKWDLKVDAWLAKKTKALERYDKRIITAQKKLDELKAEAEAIAQKLPKDDRVVVSAKRKADYAFLEFRDIVKRKKDYIDDFLSRGIILEEQSIARESNSVDK